MRIIDCRTMACPTPVVTTKRALEEARGVAVQIIVDPGAPRENVTRFAESRGFAVTEAEVSGGFALTITSKGGSVSEKARREKAKNGETVMLIASDRLGDGPEELGRLLMKNFIITLLDLDELPDRLFFVNTGVLLATEGSEVLEALDRLGNKGVEVLSCGVCLDFFNRKDKLRAGAVTNMFTIAESLTKAASVIRL
ncbi:MAG: sulfurtransferase-like selenium metabolism protein YedF [Desulfuromonadales bacterium]|nr:MAG: sulfurtransferase-like selenium metabolism protein YedF [Desulfuromonadales bacterium]